MRASCWTVCHALFELLLLLLLLGWCCANSSSSGNSRCRCVCARMCVYSRAVALGRGTEGKGGCKIFRFSKL